MEMAQWPWLVPFEKGGEIWQKWYETQKINNNNKKKVFMEKHYF